MNGHFITACRVQWNNSSRPILQPLFTAFREACKSALPCRIWLIGGGVVVPYKIQPWVKAQQKTVGGLLVPRPLWRDWFPPWPQPGRSSMADSFMAGDANSSLKSSIIKEAIFPSGSGVKWHYLSGIRQRGTRQAVSTEAENTELNMMVNTPWNQPQRG